MDIFLEEGGELDFEDQEANEEQYISDYNDGIHQTPQNEA